MTIFINVDLGHGNYTHLYFLKKEIIKNVQFMFLCIHIKPM